jgi:hypothetical protein
MKASQIQDTKPKYYYPQEEEDYEKKPKDTRKDGVGVIFKDLCQAL